MSIIRRTAKYVLPALAILGVMVLLSHEASRAMGPGRFDRFTLHNMTNENVPVAVELKRKVGDPVVMQFAVNRHAVGGHVVLADWDVEEVKCTVAGKSVTITAEATKYIEWATFWLGDDASGAKKRCGHALQSDGKILKSGPEE